MKVTCSNSEHVRDPNRWKKKVAEFVFRSGISIFITSTPQTPEPKSLAISIESQAIIKCAREFLRKIACNK